MPKELKIVITLFVSGLVLGLIALILNNLPISSYFQTPYGDSFSVFSFLRKPEKPSHIVYGYLPYWSLDNAKYIQLDRLTDISYFGLTLDANGTFRKVLDDGTAEPGYNTWKTSKELKKLIDNSKRHGVRFSVTIIAHEDDVSGEFLNCTPCWDTFITELERELNSKNIRDVNLNFESSDLVDANTANKYTEFAKFVNEKLDAKYTNSFVVVATFADSLVKPRMTIIGDLAKYVDALFIMAYDFHQPTSDNAGPVAPIGGAGIYGEYDIQTMLKDYLTVAPPNKFILGVPYYGYNWVVVENEPYATRIAGNDAIGYSQSQPYSFIMDTILENNPKILWDDLAQVPYFTYISPSTGSLRSVYFENADSLRTKYRLAKNSNMLGVGIWALGYDGGYAELWNLLKEEFSVVVETGFEPVTPAM